MTTYKEPDLPTFEEQKPDLAKKVPKSWKSKAVIGATISILGIGVFGAHQHLKSNTIPESCGVEEWWGTLSNYQYNLCIRSHHGGAFGPIYVAHLTEQEAFRIIIERLEAVGIKFNNEAVIDSIEHILTDRTIEMKLLDDANVRITHISWLDSNMPFSNRGSAFSREIAKTLTEQTPDMSVGAFHTPGQWVNTDGGNNRLTRSRANEIRTELLADLDEQIQDFIDQLDAEGVLD